MAKKLYVGNLPYSINDESLHQHFAQFGAVDSAKVIMDKETGRSKGFGFVEMTNPREAIKAIKGLNTLKVRGVGMRVKAAAEE